MDRVVSLVSLIVAGLFFVYGILGFKQVGSLTRAFIDEECIEKPYIYKAQLISSLLTSIYAIAFAYFYSKYNISALLILLVPVVYFIAIRVIIISYDYIELNKGKG